MATPLLSLKQFAVLTLGQAGPPWSCKKILNEYGQKFLPVRSTLTNLSSTQALIYVAIRSAEDVAAQLASVANSPSRAALLTQNQAPDGSTSWYSRWDILWSSMRGAVKKTDLETLQGLLTPAGVSIAYINPLIELTGPVTGHPGQLQDEFIPPWVTVGIAGTFGALASLKLQEFPFNPTAWTNDQWAALAALKDGIVMVRAGADYTSSPVLWLYAENGDLADNATQGFYPTAMYILRRGTTNG